MKKRKLNQKKQHKKRVIVLSAAVLILLLSGCGVLMKLTGYGNETDASEMPHAVENSDHSVPSGNIDEVSVSSAESSDDPDEGSLKESEISDEPEITESSQTESESSAEGSTVSETSEEESRAGTQESSAVSVVPEPVIPKADLSVIDYYDSKYFVKKLSDEQKYYFAELYKAAKEHKESVTFAVPLSEKDLTTLMYLLNYDCPELIHLNGDYYPQYTGDRMEYVDTVSFSYCMTRRERDAAIQELENLFALMKSDLEGKSDLEKETYVYDYIFGNCRYTEPPELAGSAYGSLILGYARCEGYCKGFMWCMRELGIECMCVSGLQYWDTSAMYSDHSWNIVKIGGNWYHVDITVDNVQLNESKDNPPNYGFFNVDDEFVSESREISEVYTDLGVPVCNSDDLNYHKLHHLLIPAGSAVHEETEALLREHFSNDGINALSIRFESDEDYTDAAANIESWISDFFNENSDHVYFYNTYYNSLSETIVINAWKNDHTEEE